MPDSSTGGFLQPTAINSELNDVPLARFLQQIVVGTTGIDGTLVRPRWQPAPPNIPDASASWAAIGITRRKRETFTYQKYQPDGSGQIVYRNQELEVSTSFYGPAAEANSELFAMGIMLAQNRATMQLSGFGLIGVDDSIIAPEMVQTQWLYRVDVPWRVRRVQVYTYAILDLLAAQVGVTLSENDLSLTFTVPNPNQATSGYGEGGFGTGGYGSGNPPETGYGTGGSGDNPYGS